MCGSQENSQAARQTQKTILETAALTGDADAPMKLVVLNNDMPPGLSPSANFDTCVACGVTCAINDKRQKTST